MTTPIPKFAHLQIPLDDVVNATDNFHENNIIGHGGLGHVYKGRLQWSGELIKIAALRLDGQHGGGDVEFWTEVLMLSDLKHPNIVSLIGFCYEKGEKIIVTTYAAKGSLKEHLDSPTLTWTQRLKICLGVARALSYLHYDEKRGYGVIHLNINSATILLDDNWEAKLSGFKVSIKQSLNRMDNIILCEPIGTIGYMDPEIEKTKGVTHKSDVYAFGVVLFELLCGRRAYSKSEANRFLAHLAKDHYEIETLQDIIHSDLRNQMSRNQISRGSLKRYSKTAYSCLKEDRTHRPHMPVIVDELQKAFEKALKFKPLFETITNTFAHLAIRLKEIVSATNDFDDENFLREGGFGKDYKGKLLRFGQSINIYARRLNHKYGQGDIEFETKISMLSSLEHKNIISFVGFCDEDDEKIIVYEHAVHGSLDQYLSGPNLTWVQRLKICLAVASVLSSIHYDVIHCDINSSNIFLDEDWEPKIFGFEFSTKYPQNWKHRLLFSHHFDNTKMTPKYDVYCFGVLLFEVLYGMKPMKTEHVVKVEPDDIINPTLRKQMDPQSLSNFTKITYRCLNEHPVQRPTMDQIVKELDEVLQLQMWNRENLKEHLTTVDEGTSSNLMKMEWLKIPLTEIMAATHGFDNAHFVACGGYGSVYKGELDVLDIQSLSTSEIDRPKIRTKRTVAIKCIKNRQDEASLQGFLTEIDLLTSCKHPNIISLLGFYMEARDIILVYEYATKGSLSDYLGSIRNNINLTWEKRIQICLDIARGINYLHTNMEGKSRIIHRDIKSENILLDENLNAKVADFGLSKFHYTNQQASTIHTKHIVGTEYYVDPEYLRLAKYKKESDTYSFGVVLFEILSGRLAYDPIYIEENDKGLAPIARRRYNEGTLKELIDPIMIEEDDDHVVTLNRGPNEESFQVFSRIAYQCLAETQAKRPTMEAVIKELHIALDLQGETVVLSRFWLSDILAATQSFSDIYCIGLHENDKVYKAELDDFDNKSLLAFKEKNDSEWPKTRINVAIKRISSSVDVKQRFFSEMDMRTSYKHPNVVSLLGFCDEGDDIILIYEHASNKSLDDFLNNGDNMENLTWTQRLHMCLGIARGLYHLHTNMDSQKRMIHGDMRSANILLGKNLEPKIAYFGISKFYLANEEASTLIRTKVYWDPEFERTSITKIESDIFSFGVILLEIFCGRLAYDSIYMDDNDKGLAAVARIGFIDKTIKKLQDPKLIKEVTDDDDFTSNRGPNQDSLDAFLKIANLCLEEAQDKRPTMKTVVKELEIALNFQERPMKILQIVLQDIELATKKFNQENLFDSGRYWKAYKGKLRPASTPIVVKRWDSNCDGQFQTELDILFKRKNKNIIGILGYCNEMNEKIIIYEHTPKGSLARHLRDSNLKWMKRLQICIGVASALEILHEGDVTLKTLIHRGIKSHGILLSDNWDAKVSNFELSSLDTSHQDMEHIEDDAYLDPQYKQGFLTEKSDIYSFGVILFEILFGRLASVEGHEDKSLGPLAKRYYEQGTLGEMVFEDIRKQIVSESLNKFADIAYQCLGEYGYMRPKASEVVIQLQQALEFQEDSEIWEPKLPRDYKEIMRLSQTPEIYKKKDIYKVLSKGILLPKEKVWFVLNDNGEANKLVSATTAKFSYKNHESHRWRSIRVSRFQKVAKMLDIYNLNIHVTIDNRLLSPNVQYGVYMVFKFCDPRIFSCELMYLNLKYSNRNETLCSHFATRRDDDWMMIEVYRFLNHKEDISFTFMLESFSRYYCTSGAIYVEGIEFRAVKKTTNEDKKNQKEVEEVQKSNSDLDQLVTDNGKIYLRELNGKKHLMLSAAEVLYNSEKWKPFCSKSSADSRFQNVMELLPQQVFRIKYKIESQMLSPFTEYVCYLVFKVLDRCRGLHCPVKVRDLLHRRKKKNKIIYFKSPAPLNHHDVYSVPEQRKDGWMEVIIWKFKSASNKQLIPMNLKLVTYEGTMLGLIICGFELRPDQL